MNKAREALKLALGKIKSARDCHPNAVQTLLWEAEEYLEEALAQPEQKPEMVGRITDNIKDMVLRQEVMLYTDKYLPIGTPVYTTPPQRTWAKHMRGVRVYHDNVVISVKGGNEAARFLCGELIKEMEA